MESPFCLHQTDSKVFGSGLSDAMQELLSEDWLGGFQQASTQGTGNTFAYWVDNYPGRGCHNSSLLCALRKNTLKNAHKISTWNRYTSPEDKTNFITLLFLIMGRPTDLQITHWMGSSSSPGGRKILPKTVSSVIRRAGFFFFVFRGMCASESWGTKKLVSALQKMSSATGKHLNVAFLPDLLKIHVHSAGLHILTALKYECFYLKCTFKTSSTHSWNIPCW